MYTSVIFDALEYIATMDIRVWIGAVIIAAVFAMEIVLIRKGFILSGKKRRLEKAKEPGNVLQGRLVRSGYHTKGEGENSRRHYYAVYEYELDGKTRRWRFTTGTNPDETVELYYSDSPRRVFSSDVSYGCLVDGLIYLIPVAAGIFIMKLLGYSPQ